MAKQKKNQNRLRRSVSRSLKDCGFTVTERKKLPGATKTAGVDVIAKRNKSFYLVARFQERAGTAEQKIPYLFLRLEELLARDRKIRRAFVVLGGGGWTLLSYFRGVLRRLHSNRKIVLVKQADLSKYLKKAA